MNFALLDGRWIHYDGKYCYCRGAAPDGTPRVIEMASPPYGKVVHVHDEKSGAWHDERLPFRLRGGTKAALVMAAVMAGLVPLIFSGQDPILWKFCTPIAVGFFLLVALLAQTSHLYPHDAISLAEAQEAAHEAYVQSQYEAAARAAQQQAQAAATMQQGQMAIWAQLAQINSAMHPGQDTYRPYGQSPPL